jgi:hypothetical protein
MVLGTEIHQRLSKLVRWAGLPNQSVQPTASSGG